MNRILTQTIQQESPEHVRYCYAGRIAGHVVAGEMELPKAPWGSQAGLRLLFLDLHEGCGLSFEEMEANNAVQWQMAA